MWGVSKHQVCREVCVQSLCHGGRGVTENFTLGDSSTRPGVGVPLPFVDGGFDLGSVRDFFSNITPLIVTADRKKENRCGQFVNKNLFVGFL